MNIKACEFAIVLVTCKRIVCIALVISVSVCAHAAREHCHQRQRAARGARARRREGGLVPLDVHLPGQDYVSDRRAHGARRAAARLQLRLRGAPASRPARARALPLMFLFALALHAPTISHNFSLSPALSIGAATIGRRLITIINNSFISVTRTLFVTRMLLL